MKELLQTSYLDMKELEAPVVLCTEKVDDPAYPVATPSLQTKKSTTTIHAVFAAICICSEITMLHLGFFTDKKCITMTLEKYYTALLCLIINYDTLILAVGTLY